MQTTEISTRIDHSVKLEPLESVAAAKLRSGRIKATDKLVAALTSATNADTRRSFIAKL